MAKTNGKRNLPAKTDSVAVSTYQPRGQLGNAGGGRWPDAMRLRAQKVFEKSKAIEVLGKIVSGDILEFIREKDGELVIGQTRNADRIGAVRELKDLAGLAPQKPINIEASGDVIVQVVYDE